MDFGNLTYPEIKQAADQNWIVLIPTGCTEQQGLHLPVDFDTWLSHQVCIAASMRAQQEYDIPSLVLPVFPFGPTPEHRNFGAGFIDFPQSLHEEIVFEILKSLLNQGFSRMIIWRGCGQHDLRIAINSIQSSISHLKIWQPDMPYSEIWNRVYGSAIPGGHADSFATSLAMYLRPESVRKDQILNPENLQPDWSDPNLDFSLYSTTGVIGDPTKASSKLGEKLWILINKEVAQMIKSFDERTNNDKPDK
jgi:creatinine amidohydrolase